MTDNMEDDCDGRKEVRRLRLKHVEVKSALTRTLAGLYCLLCGVFGVVFPISDALTYSESSPSTLTNAFLLYLYVVSIFIFIYFFTAVFRGGLSLKRPTNRQQDNPSNHGNGNQEEDHHGAHTNVVVQEFTVESTENENQRREVVGERVKIAYHGEGMNLYIRIGAAVFALVSIAYICIRIAEPFESDVTAHCIHPFSIFVDVIFMVFVILQTFLIFKHNQVVINLHKAVVRVCLMHLLATNLSIWVSACTREIVEDLTADNTPAENTTAPIGCHDQKSTADKIAPYLFPCIIEYSLIGAAAVYRIYLNVAKPDDTLGDVNGNGNKVHRPPPILRHTDIDLRNGVWGLVAGVVVIVLTIVSVVIFYIMDARGHKEVAVYLFLVTDICLLIVTMVTVIIAMMRTRGLAFVAKEEDSFDDKLLVIALGGFYFYSCFIIISSSGREADNYVGACFLIRELLSILQISIQTVMILDGFRRRAETDDHVVQKPGRAILAFLLTCNFALWVVNTFEIKRAEISDIHVDYYSKLAWRLVVHVSLPLVIFYRFHSTVCLSDIWQKAYQKEKEE